MRSYLDRICSSHVCSWCGHQITQVLRRFFCASYVVCPTCHGVNDIRDAKRRGQLGLDLTMALELDRQRAGQAVAGEPGHLPQNYVGD